MSDETALAPIACGDEAHLFIGRSLQCQCGALAAVPKPIGADDPAFVNDLLEFGPRFSAVEAKQQRALVALARSGKVKDACAAAGVTYGTWYRWLDESPDFVHAVEYAKEILANELEEAGLERAKDSSDALLMFFLRSLRPGKYREKQTIEVVSPDVQARLARQADAILETCRQQIADSELRAVVGSTIANRLREIWS